MPVTINGTTGIANVDGSAASPAFRNTDTNSGIAGSADQVIVSTAGTERLRVASAGQVGIGGANYGSSGQVLTSGGGSAAPSWAAAGGGKLLQVVDTLESDEILVSTQATWTDLDTSVSITPTDATTKMIIWATCQGIWKNSTCNWIGVQLVGSATGMTEYTRKLEWIYGYWTSAGQNSPQMSWMGPVNTHVVHDHNQTNAITYKLQAIVYDHSDDEATFMAWGNDNNTTSATIVVQEFST